MCAQVHGVWERELNVLPKLNSRHDRLAYFGWSLWPQQSLWIIPIPTLKELCTEGILGQHALGMLEETLVMTLVYIY